MIWYQEYDIWQLCKILLEYLLINQAKNTLQQQLAINLVHYSAGKTTHYIT